VSDHILNRPTAHGPVGEVDIGIGWPDFRKGLSYVDPHFDGASEYAGFITLSQTNHTWVGTMGVADGDNDSFFFSEGSEFLYAIKRKAERLFHENVNAAFRELHSHRNMKWSRSSDNSGGDFLPGPERIFKRGKRERFFDAVSFRNVTPPFFQGFAKGKPTPSRFLEAAEMAFSDRTSADNKNEGFVFHEGMKKCLAALLRML
jgi:hypothetical protein